LLRGREASRHSAGAAGGGHGGQRDQLHGLWIERSLRIKYAGELLQGSHAILLL